MGLHDRIREHLKENRDSLLRPLGDGRFSIRAGDVVSSMRLKNRTPAVCAVLRSQEFQHQARLRCVDRLGPRESTTTTFLYEGLTEAVLNADEPSQPQAAPTAATHQKGPLAEIPELPRADLCLVSCGRRKVSNAVPAKDLYCSPQFRKTRELVESQGWPWFILSAKHGLLDPERRTEPYDKTLTTMNGAEQEEWAAAVIDALKSHLVEVRSVVIFAGETYRKHLAPDLCSRGIEVHVPMEGLRQGEQSAWLNAQLARFEEPRGR